MDRRRRGFTLMEMLIVVAIIGILVAVAIPVFSAQLEKTRAAVCMGNRRSLQSVVTTSYMADPTSVALGADNSTVSLTDAEKENYICPSGGLVSAYLDGNHIAIVSCSKHTGGSFADQHTLDTLKKDIDEAIGGRSKLDSGAVETDTSATKALLSKLAADGIDLVAMGAESWRYVPGKNDGYSILYLSMQDINSMKVGDKVLTMRYNFNTHTYCVSQATVKTDRVDATSAVYNVLDGENLNDFKKVYPDAKDQTYENALAYYLEHYQK